MQRPPYIPEGYDRIALAESEDAFFRMTMEDRVNCVLHPRAIAGDFNALAAELYIFKTWNEQHFRGKKEIFTRLGQIAGGNDSTAAAARQVRTDIEMLKKQGIVDDLRIIGPDYYEPVIHMLHMDGGDEMDDFGTFMCGYTEPTTAWAMNEECEGGGVAGDRITKVFTLKAGARHRHFETGDMIRQAPERNYYTVDGFIHAAERRELGILLVGRRPA